MAVKDKVVVIGGGLGGLSAAAIFARKGFPVTLVEQHDVPGGYATSFTRAQGKFNFDVSLHATSGVDGGPMRELFQETGILDKVEMVELPELCRIILPDHDITWPQFNPEAHIDELCRTFPEQADGIKGFFGEIEAILREAMKPSDPDSWWDMRGFRSLHPGGATFAFADGSVHFIQEDINFDLYKATSTIAQQEVFTEAAFQ